MKPCDKIRAVIVRVNDEEYEVKICKAQTCEVEACNEEETPLDTKFDL